MDRLIQQQYKQAETTVSRVEESLDSPTLSKCAGEKRIKVRVLRHGFSVLYSLAIMRPGGSRWRPTRIAHRPPLAGSLTRPANRSAHRPSRSTEADSGPYARR